MAQLSHVLFCLAVATAVWTAIGWPIARRLSDEPHAGLWAPVLGWAVCNAVSLPLFELIGMRPATVRVATAIATAIALLVLFRQPRRSRPIPPALWIGVLAAALLALAPMLGILPKPTSEGITLASPIFDHSKVALIDEIIRSGIPAGNPFFGETGAPDRIAYYYLWHFSAAFAASLTGVSGWEADAALTGFTAFAALLTMIGLALRIGARNSAPLLVVILAATASLRTSLQWLWPDGTPALIGYTSGFGGLLFQTSWAPQHVASAMSVVMACALIPRMAERRGWFLPIVIGLIAAAAFQSSVWVGGIVFALAATAIGLIALLRLAPGQRASFAIRIAVSAAVAASLVMPFIYDQIVSTAMRGHAALVALRPSAVLGEAVPETLRRALDVPAFWLLYLPLEFPAFYPAGLLALFLLFRHRAPGLDPRRPIGILCLVVVSLATSWLVASVIGDNNDLGWRAVLPAVMVLIAFTAGLISRWPAPWARVAAMLAATGAILSLPGTVKIAGENIAGLRKASEPVFAQAPATWAAVRQHTSPTERVANNPLFLGDMTPWPVNISWALMADRRSCYAGNELAIPFAPVSVARRIEIDALFVRVFAGEAAPGDIAQLADRFRCDTILVTAQDGAWQRDPFASGEVYRLVDSRPDAWRIYRRAAK